MKCPICSEEFETSSFPIATQVYRRHGAIVTVTGIPAVADCPNCGNAILDWETAQQVEDLVQPLFNWTQTHTLPKPIVSITFPALSPRPITA